MASAKSRGGTTENPKGSASELGRLAPTPCLARFVATTARLYRDIVGLAPKEVEMTRVVVWPCMRAASHVELQAPLVFGPLHLKLFFMKAARPRHCHAAVETPQPLN